MNKIHGSASAENNGEVYKTAATAGEFSFTMDEPVASGGTNAGPSPVDCLCMALAACKAITIRMYVNRKGWKLDKVNIKASFVKAEDMPSGINTFFCTVTVTGDLNEEERKRILHIAGICPIDRLLTKPSEVVTVME